MSEKIYDLSVLKDKT